MQLNIYHFLDDIEEALNQLTHQEQDETPTVDLDQPVQSLDTKLELLTSAYLDSLLDSKHPLTPEQVHTIKILMELTRA